METIFLIDLFSISSYPVFDCSDYLYSASGTLAGMESLKMIIPTMVPNFHFWSHLYQMSDTGYTKPFSQLLR